MGRRSQTVACQSARKDSAGPESRPHRHSQLVRAASAQALTAGAIDGSTAADRRGSALLRPVRRHSSRALRIQLEPPARPQSLLRAYDTRANVFSIQQAALVIDAAPEVDDGAATGCASTCSSARPPKPSRAARPTSHVPTCIGISGRRTARTCFLSGTGLQADFGKFASNLGYETNYAKDNHPFSRAYLFNFLPFYHSGLRLTLPVNDKVTLMYMLTNGIQQTEDFNDFKAITSPQS